MPIPLLAAVLPAAIGATNAMLGNVFNNKANLQATRETNAQNLDIFNQQMDYTKATQAENWRRDDSQLVRRVADANNAGLSPLAAIGGSIPNSGNIAQPSAPHLQAPHYDSIMSGVNLDSISDAIIAAKRLEVDKQNADTAQSRMLNDKEQTQQSLKQDADINAQKLAQADKQFQATINQNEAHFDKTLSNQISQFNQNLAHQIQVSTFDQKLAYQNYLINDINSIIGEADKKTGGHSSAYKLYTEENSYNAAMNAWTSRYADFIAVELGKPTRQSASQGQSSNASAGIGEGSRSNESSYKGGSYGMGLNMSANASAGQSNYNSISTDYTERDREKITRWLNANPVPIYRPEKTRW
jgi:hypothetical protein